MRLPAKVGLFVCGIVLSVALSCGLLYLSWAIILDMVQEAGRNISMGQIVFALFLPVALLILIPWGHIYFYKQLKKSGQVIFANGLISGFFLLLSGFCTAYFIEEYEKYQATAPHSEEYLNFQRELYLEKERKRIADSLEQENIINSEAERQDSLKRVTDSIQQEAENKKDWQKVLKQL